MGVRFGGTQRPHALVRACTGLGGVGIDSTLWYSNARVGKLYLTCRKAGIFMTLRHNKDPPLSAFFREPHRGAFALVGFFVGFRQWKFADERT